MDWLTILPPITALIVAVWTRNAIWALGFAIWLSETLISGFNPALGTLNAVERAVGVFGSQGNTRILLFCLIIGALIAYIQRSGGVIAMVEQMHHTGLASTQRRAVGATSLVGILIFVETNISLLASGIFGQPLFDRLKMSRERLAYLIDSTSAPVCVLILLNGWGAYLLGLMENNGVENPISVLIGTITLNFYALVTLAGVIATIVLNQTFGSMAKADKAAASETLSTKSEAANLALDEPSKAVYMGLPLFALVAGALSFMVWTGNGNIIQGSGSQSILWAVVLATAIAFLCLAASGRAKGNLVETGFRGMGDLLPAVTVIFLALALGDSLRALGTGAFIGQIAEHISAPWTIPPILFLAGAITSFTTGTSWGTFGILVPIAIPLAVGTGIPLPLAMAAVIGGGVFGDHCSPISDTTIIASLAAGCDHMEHVKTQLPYALVAGGISLALYIIAGLVA